ncbi:unnamed protein product, partial [Sphagnum jensenii]
MVWSLTQKGFCEPATAGQFRGSNTFEHFEYQGDLDVFNPLPSMKTVLEALTEFAHSQPDKKVWSFLNDSSEVNDSYTYKELEKATDELAFQLIHTHNIRPADRVLLVFFPGLAFTASLLACFKANIVAVPVFPPDPRKLQKDLDHFVSIQKSSGATYVLTHSQYNYAKKVTDITSIFSTKNVSWPQLKWIVVDDMLAKGKKRKSMNLTTPNEKYSINTGDIAFLQYTSGSTSEPKGVMISHANLAHNLVIITKELQVDVNTTNLSWLPQYHDMGLIGSYMGTLYCGGVGYFLSPISFLKDPNVWLKSISIYRASHTQAPNFAYALAARKFAEHLKEQSRSSNNNSTTETLLNLTCVKHMINAAEPVDVHAIASFYALFTQYGLARNVIIPTYGLAEHTVFVCSGGRTLLSVNKSALEKTGAVEILSECLLNEYVEPVSQSPNSTGRKNGEHREIWVDSPSKALGYFNQPELTQESFHGIMSSALTSRTYLRTGDMGFLYSDELFICGRVKDLIIIRG